LAHTLRFLGYKEPLDIEPLETFGREIMPAVADL